MNMCAGLNTSDTDDSASRERPGIRELRPGPDVRPFDTERGAKLKASRHNHPGFDSIKQSTVTLATAPEGKAVCGFEQQRHEARYSRLLIYHFEVSCYSLICLVGFFKSAR